jgi:hypothetical protein
MVSKRIMVRLHRDIARPAADTALSKKVRQASESIQQSVATALAKKASIDFQKEIAAQKRAEEEKTGLLFPESLIPMMEPAQNGSAVVPEQTKPVKNPLKKKSAEIKTSDRFNIDPNPCLNMSFNLKDKRNLFMKTWEAIREQGEIIEHFLKNPSDEIIRSSLIKRHAAFHLITLKTFQLSCTQANDLDYTVSAYKVIFRTIGNVVHVINHPVDTATTMAKFSYDVVIFLASQPDPFAFAPIEVAAHHANMKHYFPECYLRKKKLVTDISKAVVNFKNANGLERVELVGKAVGTVFLSKKILGVVSKTVAAVIPKSNGMVYQFDIPKIKNVTPRSIPPLQIEYRAPLQIEYRLPNPPVNHPTRPLLLPSKKIVPGTNLEEYS